MVKHVGSVVLSNGDTRAATNNTTWHQVESLSASRAGMSSNEPSDSVRVVNALLTQLDSLKMFALVNISPLSLFHKCQAHNTTQTHKNTWQHKNNTNIPTQTHNNTNIPTQTTTNTQQHKHANVDNDTNTPT